MSGPLPLPTDTPETLQYRHVRTLAGLGGMVVGVVLFAVIQYEREIRDAALLARGCPTPQEVLPNTVTQLVYVFAIPIGMPLLIFLFGMMLFSPSVFAQLRQLLPWVKSP